MTLPRLLKFWIGLVGKILASVESCILRGSQEYDSYLDHTTESDVYRAQFRSLIYMRKDTIRHLIWIGGAAQLPTRTTQALSVSENRVCMFNDFGSNYDGLAKCIPNGNFLLTIFTYYVVLT